jgi:drug/metabolite transporter (DMT)-like permease
VETQSRTSPWLSQLAFAVAVVGLVTVGIGWLERPDNQLANEPALTLAITALALGVAAMATEAIASFRSLRRMGVTIALSVVTVVSAVGLLVWIALQPFGD